MTVALVCNSLNRDLEHYFALKVRGLGKEVVFYANRRLAKKYHVRTSSFTPKPTLSSWILVDCIWSIVVLGSLIRNNIRTLIFDTAHISNLPLALLCKVVRIKLVFTIHDWVPHEGRQRSAVNLYNKFVQEHLANEFIVFSGVNAKLRTHKLRLGGYPFDMSGGQGEGLLFFGRIEPYKGLDLLAQIVELLRARGNMVPVVVAGKGDDPSLGKLAAIENVSIINRFVEEEELDRLISGAAVCLVPYKSATQSGVIVKAYSFCKPVVAFDVGALSEYVVNGKTGKLVEAGDIRGFVEAIETVLSSLPEYRSGVEKEFRQFSKMHFLEHYGYLVKAYCKRAQPL